MYKKYLVLTLLLVFSLTSVIPFNIVKAQRLQLPKAETIPQEEINPDKTLDSLSNIKTKDLSQGENKLIVKDSDSQSTLKKSALFTAGVVGSIAVGIGIATLAASAAAPLAIGLAVTAGILGIIGTVSLLKDAHDSYKADGIKQVWTDTKTYTSNNPFTAGTIVGGYVCLAVCSAGSKGLGKFLNGKFSKVATPAIEKANLIPITNQLSNNGKKEIIVRGIQKLELTEHAKLVRMPQRNISKSDLKYLIQTSDPFPYFHRGELKTGYYDPVTKLFAAEIAGTGKITTVINNVPQSYINGLKATIK